MIERLISPTQKIEANLGLYDTPGKKRVNARDVEERLSTEELAVKRRLVTNRQRIFSSMFINWKHPHYHEMKHREDGESGREVMPRPSLREDGAVTSYTYRVWWGTKWVAIKEMPDGNRVEAQVRRYDEEDHEFLLSGGVFERRNPDMAICLRVANPVIDAVSSPQEAFRFKTMPMNNGEGGDILRRGDSMDLSPESWQELDYLLLGLSKYYGETTEERRLPAIGSLALKK